MDGSYFHELVSNESLISYGSPNLKLTFVIRHCTYFTAFFAADAYVCKLTPRWDSAVQRMRWAMPSVQRCVCQGVIAPKRGPMMCPSKREEYGEDSQMWYTDDPRPLTDRANWKPNVLNHLLERVDLCSELRLFYIIIDYSTRVREYNEGYSITFCRHFR